MIRSCMFLERPKPGLAVKRKAHWTLFLPVCLCVCLSLFVSVCLRCAAVWLAVCLHVWLSPKVPTKGNPKGPQEPPKYHRCCPVGPAPRGLRPLWGRPGIPQDAQDTHKGYPKSPKRSPKRAQSPPENPRSSQRKPRSFPRDIIGPKSSQRHPPSSPK